jgi:2-keto-4-pentenoate hydratase/2-oxohepta-3-ene-1,7-dioic acid hydratase in catechol pathway
VRIARIAYKGYVYHAGVACAGYEVLHALEAENEPWVTARDRGRAWVADDNELAAPGAILNEDEVVLLPPTKPGKILGVGWNFREHIKEMVGRLGRQVPKEQQAEETPPPILFFKPTSSLIGHREAIVYPKDATRVEYEGELAVVIAKTIRRVTPEEAQSAVLGWTCANDVTERDLQNQDKQWWRAKGMDTFAVAGPYLQTEAPPLDAWIRTRVNGQLRQEGQVGDMIRDPYEVISLISQSMTLERGDLIMLGTPPGVGELHPGDEVEVEIDGVGYLRNPVVAEPV